MGKLFIRATDRVARWGTVKLDAPDTWFNAFVWPSVLGMVIFLDLPLDIKYLASQNGISHSQSMSQ